MHAIYGELPQNACPANKTVVLDFDPHFLFIVCNISHIALANPIFQGKQRQLLIIENVGKGG